MFGHMHQVRWRIKILKAGRACGAAAGPWTIIFSFPGNPEASIRIFALVGHAMIELLRMKDHELAERCRRGDRDAQREVYDLFSARMYAVCCRYVRDRDDAEDVLVSAFMKVFSGIGQFRHEGSFEGWIRRIMVNEALGFLRANRRFMVNTSLEQADQEGTEGFLPDSLATNDLLELISELPDGYRMVFNLYVIDGYSHAEIASQLGISENTSKTQLAKARRRLQDRIRVLEEWPDKKFNSDGRSV